MVERLPRNPLMRAERAASREFDSRPGLMLTQEQGRRIEEFCKNFYRQQDFAHNRRHMKKTIRLAEFIGRKEGANIRLIRLGAMVHQFHDDIGTLEQFLDVLKVDDETAAKLVECTSFRPHRNIPPEEVSLEAKIVYDADILQSLGPFGTLREVASLLEEKGFDGSVEETRDEQTAFYEFLQTKTARKIAEVPHQFMQKFWEIYDAWDGDRFE